jgi:hypothetical protein
MTDGSKKPTSWIGHAGQLNINKFSTYLFFWKSSTYRVTCMHKKEKMCPQLLDPTKKE